MGSDDVKALLSFRFPELHFSECLQVVKKILQVIPVRFRKSFTWVVEFPVFLFAFIHIVYAEWLQKVEMLPDFLGKFVRFRLFFSLLAASLAGVDHQASFGKEIEEFLGEAFHCFGRFGEIVKKLLVGDFELA